MCRHLVGCLLHDFLRGRFGHGQHHGGNGFGVWRAYRLHHLCLSHVEDLDHRWRVDRRMGLQHLHRLDFTGLHLEGGLGEEENLNNHTMYPKISIIIPVYNVEPYIADCLQSVMRQTYKGEMECIIVDDCGTDNSMGVVEQLIKEYHGSIEFKVLHHEHNRGLSAARNTGMDAACGDYIYFIDSDDWISDDCLDVLVSPLQDMDYDMVLGDLELSSDLRNVVFLFKETGPIIGTEQIFNDFFVDPVLYVMAWNKLLKASLIKEHDLSFLEWQLNEDDLWRYKCCQCLKSIYVQRQVTYHYRMRDDSITSYYLSHPEKRLDSYYNTLDYVLSHPAKAGQEVWKKIIVYFINVYSRLIILSGTDCKKGYLSLRRRFVYHPLYRWMKDSVSAKDVKYEFHLLLPPVLGYRYLRLYGRLRKKHYGSNV